MKLALVSLLLATPALAVETVALPSNAHPSVSIALQFHAGAVDDPPGKAGLTDLTTTLMTEGGTQALDAKALNAALFPMATGIHGRVDKELVTIRTTVHKDHLAAMTKIITDVVAHPRFDQHDFERVRDQEVNDVEKRLRQGDDENLGKEALRELLYADHPYGRLSIGHVADLRSITLDDVKAQWKKIFTQDRLVVGVAGGYPASLPAQLGKALASLPKTGAARVAIPAASTHGPRFRVVEKTTDSTAISLGFPYGLSRKDPDFVAMTVARSAFGEHRQFNGRLMQRLREARGLNYGDYAYLEYFVQEGGDASQAATGLVRQQQDFTIWLRPVQNENRLFALRAALYELGRTLADEPFSDAEVNATKGFLDGYTLLFAQTDARKLGFAMDDHALGTKDFLRSWHDALSSVTTAQVNAAWKKWIGAGKLQVVLVTPGAAEVKKAIVANTPSPIHYQKDAQGRIADKPKELLLRDAIIEKTPFGAKGDADVEVIPVEKLFQ